MRSRFTRLVRRLRAWASHDPLTGRPPDADPRLRGSASQPDPNARFRGGAMGEGS